MYMENTWNEVNLRMEFRCAYLLNMLDESVCISRYVEQICRYTENTQNAQKVEYLSEFKNKVENILGRFPGA
jgi:hypothetical protein